MLPAVVLALGLVTTTLALPVTPEVQVATGIQGVPQTNVEVPVSQQGEKTGFQGSSEVYTPPEQIVQQNVPVPKVENVPVAVENQQASYTESPVLLPIQPLSVVPVSPVGQVLRPVIVPAEAIAAGRVIIMSIEPIQQRSFQEVVGQPEKQVPFQQVVQPAIYTPIQTQVVEPNQQSSYVQPTEKQTPVQQTVQQTEQIQPQPNQEQLIKEQSVQTVEYQNPVPQVYNVQPVVAETVPYQVPVNPHQVEPQYQVQKQGYQQVTPVQGQEVSEYQQVYQPVAVENVQKQGSQAYDVQPHAVPEGQHHQVSTYNTHPQQPVEQQVYNVQPVEQQVYNVQPVEQVYNVQPVEQQVHNVQHVEPQVYSVQPTEQQVHNVQPVPAEKQGFPHVQTPYVEPQQQQVQSVQQVIEKQASQQQPVQSNEYVPVQGHPTEPFYQQQVYSVTGQVQGQVPYQQVSHVQTAAQVPEPKSPEVGQYHQVQNQQVENFAGQPTYNYGDKLPQIQENNPIRTQNYSVQPSTQE